MKEEGVGGGEDIGEDDMNIVRRRREIDILFIVLNIWTDVIEFRPHICGIYLMSVNVIFILSLSLVRDVPFSLRPHLYYKI